MLPRTPEAGARDKGPRGAARGGGKYADPCADKAQEAEGTTGRRQEGGQRTQLEPGQGGTTGGGPGDGRFKDHEERDEVALMAANAVMQKALAAMQKTMEGPLEKFAQRSRGAGSAAQQTAEEHAEQVTQEHAGTRAPGTGVRDYDTPHADIRGRQNETNHWRCDGEDRVPKGGVPRAPSRRHRRLEHTVAP